MELTRAHRAALAGCSRKPCQVARCVQRRRIVGNVATREAVPSVSSSSVWDEFAQNATGEWEGVSASFDAEGKALPLPDYYVPSAYRDWGVEITDWQTVCSSTATQAPGFLYKLRRMMPTVGCEADAVAFTEEVQDLWSGQGASWPSSKPVLADGSFFAGPLQLAGDDTTAKLELCLTLPPAASAPATPSELQSAQKLPATLTACRAPTTGRLRHRVLATFMKHWKTKAWTLNRVEVNRERYDGPYREVVELSGCGGGMSAIAKAERGAAEEQLAGSWRLESGKQFKRAEGGSTLEAQDLDPSEASTAGGGGSWEGALALPAGTSVRWRSGEQGDGFTLEVGVGLEDPAARRLGAVTYAQGTLQAVVLATAKRP